MGESIIIGSVIILALIILIYTKATNTPVKELFIELKELFKGDK